VISPLPTMQQADRVAHRVRDLRENGLSQGRRRWLATFYDERALCDDAGNRAHRRQHRRGHYTDRGQRNWNLHDGVSLLVLNNDALNVPLVDKFLDFVH
jgi:hypothetical protein